MNQSITQEYPILINHKDLNEQVALKISKISITNIEKIFKHQINTFSIIDNLL
jgi:hypothetical protein